MKPFILLHKPRGITPLAAIELFRKQHPDYASVTLGAAGRLDPMASGLLMVLTGEENKKRKQYEVLQKTYTMEILFGFATDSHDLLGLVTQQHDSTNLQSEVVSQTIANIPDEFEQEYPIYSSKPVKGKPLYWWARNNKLDQIELPKKSVKLLEKKLLSWRMIEKKELSDELTSRIRAVSGNFRQEEILGYWSRTLNSCEQSSWPLATITITCTSGTYMRGLAHAIGLSAQTGALAYSITRTNIGDYSLDQSTTLL